jgi:hypothetical protein
MWILHCEKERREAWIRSLALRRIPLHRREAAEDITLYVQYQRYSVRVTIAPAVELARTEPITAATPEKVELLCRELSEDA